MLEVGGNRVTVEDENTEVVAPPMPKPLTRQWQFWLRTVWWLSLTPLIFGAVAALMLVGREVEAPDWISDDIAARASEFLDGGALDVRSMTVRLGRDLHPTVRLTDITLRDANGALISRIPVAEGVMSPRGLILRQEVLMQNIALVGAQINLRRGSEGDVAVAFGSGLRDAGQAPSLTQLLEKIDVFLERPAFEALEGVRATGLVVNFDDARAGRAWVVDGGSLSLVVEDGQTLLNGDFALLSGRAEVTTVALSYASPIGSRDAQMGLNIDNVVASDIATQSPALSWLSGVNAPVKAAIRTSLDSEAALGPLNASLEIGKGALQPNAATQPIGFEAARAYLTYDPARATIRFDEVHVETELGQLNASGHAYLQDVSGGLPQSLLTQFQFRDIAFNPVGLFTAPLTLQRASMDARIRFNPFSVELGQVAATEGDMRLLGKGNILATDAGWQVGLDVGLNQISQSAMMQYWPEGISPGARRWVDNNIKSAEYVDAHAGLRISPNQAPQFAINTGFEDAELTFMRSMPAISNGSGSLSIIGKRLSVDVAHAEAIAPQGGLMMLDGSSFVIDEMGKNPPAAIALKIDSTVTAVLSVLNQPPFGFLSAAGLPVTLADGRSQLSGQLRLPLKPRISNEEIAFDMEALVTGMRSDVLIAGRQLASPRLNIVADRAGLSVKGPLRVGDVPLQISWKKQFTQPAGASTLVAETELSERFLDEFNIALPSGTVSGRGRAALTVTLANGVPPQFTLSSNTRGLELSIPVLGWRKTPEQTADLFVEGRLGNVPVLSKLSLNGAGLAADGQIILAVGGTLEEARFDRVAVGDWLDVPLIMRPSDEGVAIDVTGGQIDLRSAPRGGAGASTGGNDRGGPLQVQLDRLQINDTIALTDFQGQFRVAGGMAGQFAGQVNGAAAVSGTVAPRNGRSALRVRGDDAGAIGRASGLITTAIGGSLDLTLVPVAEAEAYNGAIAVRGVRVRDAPAMAALLDAISVVGLVQQLDGQGLSFDTVDAQFQITKDDIAITSASAIGPGLGISLDGVVGLESKQLDLQGVISPFYILNGIGSVLTRPGEGLIGFNFDITGTADASNVSVNPLSAFTPGMFREIFRRAPPQIVQ